METGARGVPVRSQRVWRRARAHGAGGSAPLGYRRRRPSWDDRRVGQPPTATVPQGDAPTARRRRRPGRPGAVPPDPALRRVSSPCPWVGQLSIDAAVLEGDTATEPEGRRRLASVSYIRTATTSPER